MTCAQYFKSPNTIALSEEQQNIFTHQVKLKAMVDGNIFTG